MPAGVLALGLAGWMSPSASAPVPRVEPHHPAAAVPRLALAPDTQLEVAQLRTYTDAMVAPVLQDRSPFAFAAPHRAIATAPGQVRDAAAIISAPVPMERRTPPALVGIAEQNDGASLVRTAIFADPDGTVHFALIGGTAGAFRVASIDSSRVVLVGSGDGGTATLTLK